MATPRPYSVGPYGAGVYERWIGNLYECGGLAEIVFTAQAKPQRIWQLLGNSEIIWDAQATPLRIQQYAGASSIAWDAQGAATMIFRPWAISEIVWDVWSDGLGLTWGDITDPCQGGVWAPAEACVPGWATVYAPCSTGAWTATTAAQGSWETIDPGGLGTWIPANPSTPGPRAL